MYQNTCQQTKRPANQDTRKYAGVPHYEKQSTLHQHVSEPSVESHFITLVKDFDVHHKGSAHVLPSFNIPEPNKTGKPTSEKDSQQKQSGYRRLDRSWANRSQRRPLLTSDAPLPNRSPVGSPLSRWKSEAPTEEPYHTIGSVADDRAAHSSRTFTNILGTRDPASSEAVARGSSNEHHI